MHILYYCLLIPSCSLATWIIVSVLQMRKLRLKVVKCLTQGHRVGDEIRIKP